MPRSQVSTRACRGVRNQSPRAVGVRFERVSRGGGTGMTDDAVIRPESAAPGAS